MDAETLRELIDTAYESGISANTLELASVCFGDDYEVYREAILHVFEQQALENLDEEALLLIDAEYPEMALMYKNDWYGDVRMMKGSLWRSRSWKCLRTQAKIPEVTPEIHWLRLSMTSMTRMPGTVYSIWRLTFSAGENSI